jgi:amino acid adenylation domain-containing protein
LAPKRHCSILSLSVEDLDDGLSCKLVYNQDLFSKDTAQSYLQHFQNVLDAVVTEPEIRLSEISWSETKTSPKRVYATPIVDPEIQDRSNLSGTQSMIWAGQKFRPDSRLYNLPYKFTINGHIDRFKFEQSLQQVIDKTDALRTVIIEEDGIPQRSILAQLPVNLRYLDFSEISDPMTSAKNWIKKESQHTFNLSERLFETALIQLSKDHWIWFLHIHHLIVDNLSVQLIFDRLEEIYQTVFEDRDTRDIKYPQYEDFVSFEKKNRRSPQYQASRAYWTKKVSSPSEPLLFYGDRRHKGTTLIKRRTFELNTKICAKLNDLAEKDPFFIKSVDATLTNIFASLVYAFLYRITQSRELSIGIHFHNRRTPQFQQTVGILMEVLPLGISIDEDETFSTLIQKVNREASEILQNRNVTIGNPIHNPIYEITLNFQTLKVDSFLGSPTEILRIHNGHEEDTLGVQIRDYGASGKFILDFDFHCDVFSKADQLRSIQYFKRLLESVLDNPDQSLDDIDLLSENELEWLLYEINQTQKPLGVDTTVVQLIERQAEKFPENIAVIHEDNTLTYSQLNSKANQLAHKLRNMGLEPVDQVGIFVSRSVEMVVGILGILKAGCAYLPLDPNHPADRLNYILEDSGVAAVLTQEDLLDRLPSKKIRMLILDQLDDFIEKGESNPLNGAGPEHAAYMIYTSGSTGEPKGVTVEHNYLLNFTEWASDDWEISPSDRVLQFTSISWDTHIEEIFPTLCSGATLVLRPDTMIDTFQGFIEIIQREEISIINLPTAFWHELTDAIEDQELSIPPKIRLVIIGGDRANHHRVASWLKNQRPEVRLVNTYGLTECTCIVTQFDLTQEFNPEREVVPIGKPINNAQIFVLDQHMKPIPAGLPGDLWIGGAGLARGYINKQQLTGDVFHQNPFAKSPGDRIYRSGDIVRHLPDGNLEMLGRIDNQVKIRGNRIELGEIEVVLSKHEAIKDVLVVVRGSDRHPDPNLDGEKRLVAYYLSEQNIKRDDLEEEFRNFLHDKLPDYMIPTIFIKLETFPFNPHGKVDRQALPPPGEHDIERAHRYTPPRNSTESQLVDIWQQVLDVQPIGVKDNFFDLGGHSLLAVRLFSLIEKEMGIKLPLMTLFDAPTIENQSKSLLSKREEIDPAWIVDVQTSGSKPPFFCVSPSVIDVITYRELSRNMGEDQPFFALYSESMGLWREGIEQLEIIAKQFIEKIREIDQQGPYFIGGYSAGGIVALEIATQLKKQDFNVGLVVLFDTFGPNYPRLLPGITPRIFNALRVVRRIQSYWWKFRLLDWKGKLQQLRFPKVHTWVRDRYGEVRAPVRPTTEKGAYFITPARRKYKPGNYDGEVLLVRAEKGFLGIRRDPMMGWGEVFSSDLEVCMVPGDHEAMLFGPRSKYVAERLTSYLASSIRKLQD